MARCSLFLVLLLTAGCGSDDRLPTYPATGTVQWEDGTPVAGGGDAFVVFESVERKVTATGAIHADGTFEVGTYEPEDGAVEGRHRVSVTPPTAEGDPDSQRPAASFPAKYRNLDTSGLEVKVTLKGENHFTLVLTGP